MTSLNVAAPCTRRALLAAGAALAFGRAPAAAEGPRRFGKSHAQIVEMGLEKWMEFQGSKAGQSTAAMNEGMSAYREALRWRNDRLAPRAPRALRGRVAALRPLLVSFTADMMQAGYYVAGGGTIWSNFHAATLVESEETLHRLLTGAGPAAQPRTTGEVLRALATLEKNVKDTDYPERDEDRRAATRAVARARETFRKISAQAGGMDRKRSDHVLDFCLDAVTMGDDLAG